MTTTSTIPLVDQVRQALEAFTAAHVDAEGKIAAAATLKLTVGANESERKAQKASMPTDEYAGYVLHLAEAEREKAAAVAHLERVEKTLNVLRELLNHDTATVNRSWAELADRTAQRYTEITMAPPARPIVFKTVSEALPF